MRGALTDPCFLHATIWRTRSVTGHRPTRSVAPLLEHARQRGTFHSGAASSDRSNPCSSSRRLVLGGQVPAEGGSTSRSVGLVSGTAFARLPAVIRVIQTPSRASELSGKDSATLRGLSGRVQVTLWPVV